MRKTFLALLGVFLVGVATIIQMIVDYYQSYAQGIPTPNMIKALVLLAGALSLIAVVISLKAGEKE